MTKSKLVIQKKMVKSDIESHNKALEIIANMISEESMKQLQNLIDLREIKMVIDPHLECRGHTDGVNPIIYLRPSIQIYAVLHEIGHLISGYGCCREHEEYITHGIAIGLAIAFKIDLNIDVYEEIAAYAGRSSHKACAIIERESKKKINEEKDWKRQ